MASQEERILNSIIEALDRGEATMIGDDVKGLPTTDYSSMNGFVSTPHCVPPLTEGKVLQWFDEAFQQIECLEVSERERVCKWVLSKVTHLMKKEGVIVHAKA